ncbi:MAG TPA: murein L,D-transpeptidase catalytic domain family protein [Ferruginibacter sp.]|nr:murein L,D-transpeptidase catalytic domain family protein [Ferruginibacter sp.]
MKLYRRIFITGIVMVVATSVSGYFFWYRPKFKSRPAREIPYNKTKEKNSATFLRLKDKSSIIKAYAGEHGYNPTHCFLLDMKLPSGEKRFFVYNLEKDSIEIAGLVTHGSGPVNNGNGLSFSNTPNSNCTSLGKYKIGNPYTGRFGPAYKLYGLDKTNSKAFERFVVLHSHSCVPNEEVAPYPICESQGCPTVAPAFLVQLKEYLKRSPQPVLLWIYY